MLHPERTKAFITNAGVGGVAVVMAVSGSPRKQKGISAFILDKGLPGFKRAGPTGSSGCTPRTRRS